MIQQPSWQESIPPDVRCIQIVHIEDILAWGDALDDRQYRIFECGIYSDGRPSCIEVQCKGRKGSVLYAASHQIDSEDAAQTLDGAFCSDGVLERIAGSFSRKLAELGFLRVDEFTCREDGPSVLLKIARVEYPLL